MAELINTEAAVAPVEAPVAPEVAATPEAPVAEPTATPEPVSEPVVAYADNYSEITRAGFLGQASNKVVTSPQAEVK